MSDNIRPTRKQHELLGFIEKFITEHGYSPSYREIMNGLDYNSIATVALHVNNLIKRGHLQKRDYSARSLELVKPSQSSSNLQSNQVQPGEEKWLVDKVDYYFKRLEQSSVVEAALLDELYVLIGCLKVLGLNGAVQSFLPRLNELKQKTQSA
jgi:SOS-response transcriptional repressor LexA